MKTGCVLKGIAFLAGTVILSGIAPSWANAEYYVSKHSGSKEYSSKNYNSERYHASREPWLDVDIVKTEPPRVVYQTTVQHAYYDDDDRYEHGYHKHNKHRHHHNHHKKCGPPPGWYKRVSRGCVMPYDIYAYREPVPQYVLVQMPPQPPGVVHIMVGGKVIRLMEATRTIMDVFDI